MAVSMPLSVLPGHGSSAKGGRAHCCCCWSSHAGASQLTGTCSTTADCTELSLGSQGIEQLAGFETLANLEVLWLNDNKLSCLCNLDHNTRIRQLYVHNNRLSTLYGSLTKLKFLTHLDVSCNQLKGLSKVLVLKKLRYLQELTLQVCWLKVKGSGKAALHMLFICASPWRTALMLHLFSMGCCVCIHPCRATPAVRSLSTACLCWQPCLA